MKSSKKWKDMKGMLLRGLLNDLREELRRGNDVSVLHVHYPAAIHPNIVEREENYIVEFIKNPSKISFSFIDHSGTIQTVSIKSFEPIVEEGFVCFFQICEEDYKLVRRILRTHKMLREL